MGIVIVCLSLEDVGEGCHDRGGHRIVLGNSIDSIVHRYNPQATAAIMLLWWTGARAFIVAIV